MFGWFSKGKISVQLPKYNFALGETMKGNITYTVKKPIHANAITVQVYAEQRTTTGYGKNRSTNTMKVFDFSVPISGEIDLSPSQTYTNEFEVTLPASVSSQAPSNAVANTVLAAASMISGSTKQIKWYVKARVDVPGFDMTKKVAINVA